MVAGSSAIDIQKSRYGKRTALPDAVAIEEPLEIRLGFSTPEGRALQNLSVTMRTPGDDRALAAGFLFTESIVRSAADIASIDVCGPPAPDSGNHNVVRVELEPHVDVDLGRLKRNFYTTSSCGVCGKTSLDALRVTGLAPFADGPRFPDAVIIGMPDNLRLAQRTFEDTGGLHAAAAFDNRGEVAGIAEDVGRHNAVDKLVGRLLLDGRLPGPGFGLMVSGRASFELMQKALVAGMPLLAAVSAPSSLAVALAREFNMTLIGFLRGETFNIYSGAERLCR